MRVLCNFHNGALETPHQGMLRLQLKPVYMVGLWTIFYTKSIGDGKPYYAKNRAVKYILKLCNLHNV